MSGKKKRGALFKVAAQTLRSTMSRPSPLPNTHTLRAAFTPAHAPDVVYMPWLRNDPDHLLAPKINKEIAARPRNTLWWCVITPIGLSPRRNVRNWLERRVRVVFEDALKWRGFDIDGRWKGVKEGRVHPAATEWLSKIAKPLDSGVQDNLVGTLRMSILESSLLAPIDRVRRDTVAVLDSLIKKSATAGPQQSRTKDVRIPKLP